jgi:hypothetical protein
MTKHIHITNKVYKQTDRQTEFTLHSCFWAGNGNGNGNDDNNNGSATERVTALLPADSIDDMSEPPGPWLE